MHALDLRYHGKVMCMFFRLQLWAVDGIAYTFAYARITA
jgi:hypothetical protein